MKRTLEEEQLIEEDLFKEKNLSRNVILKKYENIKTAENFMDIIE